MIGYIKEENVNQDISQFVIQPDISYLKSSNASAKLKKHLESLTIQLYQKHSGYLLVPYFYKNSEIKQKILINNKPDNIKEENVLNKIKLREGHQTECYNKCIKSIGNNSFVSGIINLTTSSGKTILSLKLIEYVKVKTIIIVNKLELLEQWRLKIQEFLPNCKIGLIQGKNIADKDCDIILAMVQTLCINKKLDYTELDSYKFGLCIIDEVHSIPTKLFTNVFFKINCKYQFGLTATIERNDNLHKIIEYFIGDIIYSNVESVLKQQTDIIIYSSKEQIAIHQTMMFGEEKINMSKMLNNLCSSVSRNNMILDIINELVKDKNRKILCMSDRIQQIEYLFNNLDKDISGKFIGKMKSSELAESRKKQVLLASYSLVVQGFDQPDINTLIFCTPRSNIEQAIGRIYRKIHDTVPLIIDIEDQCYVFKNQLKKRKHIYMTKIENPVIIYK